MAAIAFQICSVSILDWRLYYSQEPGRAIELQYFHKRESQEFPKPAITAGIDALKMLLGY